MQCRSWCPIWKCVRDLFKKNSTASNSILINIRVRAFGSLGSTQYAWELALWNCVADRGQKVSGGDVRSTITIFQCFNNREYVTAPRIRSRCMQHHMDIFEKADFIVTPTTACTASPVREVAEKYGELDYQNGGKLMRFIIAGNLRSASNFYTGRVWWQRVANRAPADWEAMVRSYTAANGNCIWENLCTSTPTWSLFRPPEMIQPEPRWKHLLLSGFRRVRT